MEVKFVCEVCYNNDIKHDYNAVQLCFSVFQDISNVSILFCMNESMTASVSVCYCYKHCGQCLQRVTELRQAKETTQKSTGWLGVSIM